MNFYLKITTIFGLYCCSLISAQNIPTTTMQSSTISTTVASGGQVSSSNSTTAISTSAGSNSSSSGSNTTVSTKRPAPKPVVPTATVSKVSANSESDEFTVTTASCAYFDERCRPSEEGEKPQCSGTSGGAGALKPCDSESHLECFQSVRHNYEKTCHCKQGTIRNPYDKHRCIPAQNHTRQWGDSCIEADDEKCDYEKFLRCTPNAEQKPDAKGRVPSHICACVKDKFVAVKVLDKETNRSECYINRTDKYLIMKRGAGAKNSYSNANLVFHFILLKIILVAYLC